MTIQSVLCFALKGRPWTESMVLLIPCQIEEEKNDLASVRDRLEGKNKISESLREGKVF